MRHLIVAQLSALVLAAALKPVAPVIEQVFPQSLRLGETADVIVEGNFLDRARLVRFESALVTGRIVESSFMRTKIRVSTDSQAQAGLYSGRIETERGITNLFHLRLTGWRTMSESEPNDQAERATVVQPPVSLNGVIDSYNDSDFYRFHARARERLAFNLFMGRNGYATGHEIGHFTLSLLDSSGKVLHTQLSRFLMDPYFQFTFEREGDYSIVVNHSRMAVSCLESECDHRRTFASYQLAIGASPVLWGVWPPAGRAGSTVEATVRADFIDRAAGLSVSGEGVSARIVDEKAGEYKVEFQIDPKAREGMRLVSTRDPAGLAFPLTFQVFQKEFKLESEPDDTRDQSPLIEAPLTLVGRMDHSRDVDSFFFKSTGAEALSFRLTTRSLGSEMADPNLHVLCKEGDIAMANDDDMNLRNPRSRDPYVEFKVGDARACANHEDGFYVQIRDSSIRFGPSSFYVFQVTKPEPSFDIGLRTERVVVERGRKASIPITLRRYGGFNGDVEVALEGAPNGVEVKPLIIHAGSSSGNLDVTAAASAAEGTGEIRLSASAKINGATMKKFATLQQPIPGDGIGFVQTAEQASFLSVVEPMTFALERIPPPGAGFAADRHKLMLSSDRTARVIVHLDRGTDFTHPVEYSMEGLPPGMRLENVELKDNGATANLSVKAEPGARFEPAEYRVTVIASAATGGRQVREAMRAFFIRVEK